MRKLAVLAVFASLIGFGTSAQEPIKVGTLPTSVPFTFLDIKTNQIDGAMIEMMNEVAALSGFKVKHEAIEWRALIPSVTSGKIDATNALFTITPERSEILDFSIPLFPYSEGLVVKSTDSTEYKSAKDFAGKVVGVQSGTSFYKYLQEVGGFSEIKVYDNFADIIKDIELGRLSAAFLDYPLMKYRISQKIYTNVRLVPTYQPAVHSQVAFSVKKGNKELLDKINAGVSKLKASGRLAEIMKKWNVD